MKANKLIYLLVCALALTFAATGCRKKPVGVTQLPGQPVGRPGGDRPVGLPSGGVFSPGEGITAGGVGTTGLEEFDGLPADRAALAAHTVYFPFDSSVVKPDERPKVAAVAEALRANVANKLLIEGHCDERGTEEYNRALGERRALALREALAMQGVSPDRIRTISYGEDRPAAMGHDESAWRLNRRGEFVLLLPR